MIPIPSMNIISGRSATKLRARETILLAYQNKHKKFSKLENAANLKIERILIYFFK